jgi:hypothetical protein
LGLRISGRKRYPIGRFAIETDLKSILSRPGKGNVEDEHCPGLDIDDTRRGFTELHRALTAQQLTTGLVHETNPYGVDPDFGAPSADSEY